jgi:hypothetical protein
MAGEEVTDQEYEMKAIYESRGLVNDTLTFYKHIKNDRVPIDCIRFPRRGNKYYVLGFWRDYAAAENRAEIVLGM